MDQNDDRKRIEDLIDKLYQMRLSKVVLSEDTEDVSNIATELRKLQDIYKIKTEYDNNYMTWGTSQSCDAFHRILVILTGN